MKQKIDLTRLLFPLISFLFCPITIVFLWSLWPEPIFEPETDLIEEIQY